jgi:hypothetical protein
MRYSGNKKKKNDCLGNNAQRWHFIEKKKNGCSLSWASIPARSITEKNSQTGQTMIFESYFTERLPERKRVAPRLAPRRLENYYSCSNFDGMSIPGGGWKKHSEPLSSPQTSTTANGAFSPHQSIVFPETRNTDHGTVMNGR